MVSTKFSDKWSRASRASERPRRLQLTEGRPSRSTKRRRTTSRDLGHWRESDLSLLRERCGEGDFQRPCVRYLETSIESPTVYVCLGLEAYSKSAANSRTYIPTTRTVGLLVGGTAVQLLHSSNKKGAKDIFREALAYERAPSFYTLSPVYGSPVQWMHDNVEGGNSSARYLVEISYKSSEPDVDETNDWEYMFRPWIRYDCAITANTQRIRDMLQAAEQARQKQSSSFSADLPDTSVGIWKARTCTPWDEMTEYMRRRGRSRAKVGDIVEVWTLESNGQGRGGFTKVEYRVDSLEDSAQVFFGV